MSRMHGSEDSLCSHGIESFSVELILLPSAPLFQKKPVFTAD